MNRFFSLLFLFLSIGTSAQTLDQYLESIRNDQAKLTAFFSLMPKGGDLHHHYSGSVYAETYLEQAILNDYFVHTQRYEVAQHADLKDTLWKKFSDIKPYAHLQNIKEALLKKWSVWHYDGTNPPSEVQFFSTFYGFSDIAKSYWKVGLNEIVKRAKTENLAYIETMFSSATCPMDTSVINKYTLDLIQLEDFKNELETQKLLKKLHQIIKSNAFNSCVADYCNDIQFKHKTIGADDSSFLMRYQTYVVRTKPNNLEVFKDMVAAFEAANKSPLIVGVNILAPEHDENALKHYWLHMQMFKFCHAIYPNVNIALHAGELTLGLVRPEELTNHIYTAVQTGGAQRIGHGIDIAFEKNAYALLKDMASNQIAVEINLSSNEFILGIKDREHPIQLYLQYNVPIVLGSDDAGVLRTNLSHQYVLLASRYSELTYSMIKEINLNGLRYSFIQPESLKQSKIKELEKQLLTFEKEILNLK